MKANMLLGQEAGFSHAFCYAVNFKTSKSLERLKFHKIAEEHYGKFEVYGTVPYREVEKDQEITRIWLRKLDPVLSV